MLRKLFFNMIVLTLSAQMVAYGAPATAVTPASGIAKTEGLIGIAAAVKGAVQLKRDGKVGRDVASGEPIYLGDEITTDAEGHLQIILMDETVFTLGPNSAMTIDEFVYDPSNDNGKVEASITKGVFRFITGKIARKKPENMNVRLPNGTIGVRGTITAGDVGPKKSLVMLMGPGEKTNTDHKIGSFVLTNEKKGENKDPKNIKRTHVKRNEYGSEIEGDGAPSKAFKVPKERVNKIVRALNPGQNTKRRKSNAAGKNNPNNKDKDDKKGANDPGGPGDPNSKGGKLAGQSKFGAKKILKNTKSINTLSKSLGRRVNRAAQKTADDNGSVIGKIATKQQLRSLTGEGIYNGTGTLNSGGSYSFHLHINFGNKTIGGADSRVQGTSFTSAIGNFNMDINQRPIVGNGIADFTFAVDGTCNNSTSGCTGKVTALVKNTPASSSIGTNIDHTLIVRDGDTPTLNDSGSGTAVIE